ncbi:hypothetical protein FA13DRAFT_151432 [Coprinellus micaceus]|uniref:Uncharacterized protein n=1 Tax=Coprinellus micaceus TaxID=71717 RepID=A0A4Y7THF5_COPMI|nr:hypothetical protein FA13DRAFT_151432 [Coprinellus micaceus]
MTVTALSIILGHGRLPAAISGILEGEFGTTYLNTLQSTTASSASFSFTFDGDAARVMGTSSVQNAKTNPNPTWECYLDGVAQGKEADTSTVRKTTGPSASSSIFLPGRHTIRVDVESNGGPFLLEPNTNTSPRRRVDNRLMMNSLYRPRFNVRGNLERGGENGLVRPRARWFSDLLIHRISVYGMYMNQLSHSDSPASYQIDNEPPVSFT